VASRGPDALRCAVVVAPLAKLQAAPTAIVLALGLVLGCYQGFDVEDKEPPPGHPGGTCLNENCYDPGACYVEENVCIDPADPCKGIYCAGHGTCGIDIDTNHPFCSCDAGYTNEPYAYFCIPVGL
jgi:hypothetical protein